MATYEVKSSRGTIARIQTPAKRVFQVTGSPRGPIGPVGPVGPASTIPGPTGPQGPAGDGAYTNWLAQGNTGTVAQFLASLVGPQGNQGLQGPTGPQGPQGPQGIQGEQGVGTIFNDMHTAQKNLTGSGLNSLSGLVNGANAAFTVPEGKYIADTLQVYANGALVPLGDGVTLTSPTTGVFTFVTAPATGTQIVAIYQTQTATASTVSLVGHTHAQADVSSLVSDLAAKQATLVSGTNIKTVNGTSLLGSGDVVITGSGGSAPDATTTVKGIVQLAGDLAGTAAAPTVPGLAAKADKTYVDSQDTALQGQITTNTNNVSANTTAISGKVAKTGDTMTGKLSVGLTGASAETAAIEASVDTTTASQPAVYAHNATNFAHNGEIIKLKAMNATDTGNVLRVENAGTGKNISSANGTAETFSVDKAGNVVGLSLTAGTSTDVLGTALSVMRNSVAVGRIDNNANGLRVQAQTGSLQLRGTGNTGLAIDSSGNTVAAGTIDATGLTVASVAVPTISSTSTLTNKRLTARVGTVASSATPTPTGDTADMYTVTALAAGATIAAPTGTPTDGQELTLRVKDNGTAQTLAFNAIYRFSSDLAAPTTTVISKTLYMKFRYNAADTKWDCLAWLNNF